MYIFRNRTYAKLQVARNVTQILAPYVNTSRRSTGLISMRTNDIKATVKMAKEEEEVAVVAVVVAVVQVPTMRLHTEVMKCQ